MKVIKMLRPTTPYDELKRFLVSTPLATKILLFVVSILTIILLLVNSGEKYMLSLRLPEIFFFALLALSQCRREESNGTIYFVLSCICKCSVIILAHTLARMVVPEWPKMDYLTSTAVPIQYCLVLSVQEALSCPEELKFILIRPLQVKARFHPLLIMICLSLASLRIDIILTAAVGAVLHCICFNQLLLKLAHPCDPKRLGDRMLQMGFLKTNSANRTDKNIDEIATNESIIIE